MSIFFEFGLDLKQQVLDTAIEKTLDILILEYIWIEIELIKVEEKSLDVHIMQYIKEVFLEYIDDNLFVRTRDRDKLEAFLERFNSLNPNLNTSLDLDIVVSIKAEGFVIDLFILRPTDSHQYWHYESSHHIHTKISIVYSQSLRSKLFCSNEENCLRHLNNRNSLGLNLC